MSVNDENREPTPPDPTVGNAVPWARGTRPPTPVGASGPGGPIGAGGSPQDAPVGSPVNEPTTTPLPAPAAPPAPAPLQGHGYRPTPPSQPPTPVREVTHLPAPGAPNWGLVLTGLAFMIIAAGVILNQVNGFQVRELQPVGPTLLITLGVASALVGIIGLVTRRAR